MFRPKTLFVIGAGASAEIDFPLGKGLIGLIAKDLNLYLDAGHLHSGEGDFFQLLRNHIGSTGALNEYLQASRSLAKSLTFATSIDQHLDTHADDQKVKLCGKAAIVYQILKAEENSALKDDREIGEPNIAGYELTNSWFNKFASLLFQGVQKNNLKSLFDGISIVCFNYDRCIERFLPYAIKSHFRIDLDEAQAISRLLKILHPYGTLGPLPEPNEPRGLKFGTPPRNAKVFEISSRLKTFTEQLEDEDTLAEIRSEVENAETIVFLGFGFLSDNMRILKPEKRDGFPRVFATAFNVSEADRIEIKNELFSLLETRDVIRNSGIGLDLIELKNLKCNDLFGEYWRSLQAR